jgi:putative glutamine amidotransferase
MIRTKPASGRAAPTVAVLIGRAPGHRYSVHRGYLDAVIALGAQPVLVPVGPGSNPDRVLDLVGSCDAVILTGGNDIDPDLYGQAPGQGEQDPDADRDRIEVAVVRASLSAGQPVLGICRGIQLLAVADGGTLIVDLPSAGFGVHSDEEREAEPVHEITADIGSLAHLALAGASQVNSIHHQAVATPGTTLRASAWGPDGIIEAVEAPGVLGVQWHPERLFASDPRHLAPFRWVMSA